MPAADWNLCGRGQDLLTVRQLRAVCDPVLTAHTATTSTAPRRDEQDGLCPLRCPRRGLSDLPRVGAEKHVRPCESYGEARLGRIW